MVEEQPINISALDGIRLIDMAHNQELGWKLSIGFYKLLKVFYSAFYFYYMPFFIVFWPLLAN